MKTSTYFFILEAAPAQANSWSPPDVMKSSLSWLALVAVTSFHIGTPAIQRPSITIEYRA